MYQISNFDIAAIKIKKILFFQDIYYSYCKMIFDSVIFEFPKSMNYLVKFTVKSLRMKV